MGWPLAEATPSVLRKSLILGEPDRKARSRLKLLVQTVVGTMGERLFESVVRASGDAKLEDNLCSDVEHSVRRRGDPRAFCVMRKIGG